MEYDLHSTIKVFKVIGPTDGQAAGASTVGAIIDTKGFESFEYVIDVGTITTGTFSLTLEEDTVVGLGTATAVPAANLLGALPTFTKSPDESDTITRVGINAKKQFQRLTLVGASTPVADFTVWAILGHAKVQPVPVQDNN